MHEMLPALSDVIAGEIQACVLMSSVKSRFPVQKEEKAVRQVSHILL
jgi:hypothetical protein